LDIQPCSRRTVWQDRKQAQNSNTASIIQTGFAVTATCQFLILSTFVFHILFFIYFWFVTLSIGSVIINGDCKFAASVELLIISNGQAVVLSFMRCLTAVIIPDCLLAEEGPRIGGHVVWITEIALKERVKTTVSLG
jgi:hypothetical protein